MSAADPSVTCCFTGHRPDKLSEAQIDAVRWRLRAEIERAVRDGYTHFISGMSRGVDTYAAQIVLDIREEHPLIKLEAAVPCLTQADRWCEADRELYQSLLLRCDVVTCLSPAYTRNCMILRNDYMVKSASRIIAFYNGDPTGGTAVTVQMARRAGINIINLYESAEDCHEA